MKRILVATDFSTRSDRALRRATLLARQHSAEIAVVHVIDDDQPSRLLKAQEREARNLLDDLAATAREIDRLPCDTRLMLGEPFQAIAEMAEAVSADVIVMGQHRRQALRDVFIGTTIERTIRYSRHPIIMANAIPAGRYNRVLVATDLSDCSATAVTKARELGMEGWLMTPDTGYKSLPLTLPGLQQFLRAGQWVQAGGGLPTGLMTARAAIQAMADRIAYCFRYEVLVRSKAGFRLKGAVSEGQRWQCVLELPVMAPSDAR